MSASAYGVPETDDFLSWPPNPFYMPKTFQPPRTEKKMSAHDPDHYKFDGIEAIDYMRAISSPEEFQGHCKLNAIKYLSRRKASATPLEDASKAQRYIYWLIESLEQNHHE